MKVIPTRKEKKSSAVLDYTFDFSNWLGTDTISSYAITGTGITVDSDSNNTTSVTVWLSSGTVGVLAKVDCTITTTAGRTDTGTVIFDII